MISRNNLTATTRPKAELGLPAGPQARRRLRPGREPPAAAPRPHTPCRGRGSAQPRSGSGAFVPRSLGPRSRRRSQRPVPSPALGSGARGPGSAVGPGPGARRARPRRRIPATPGPRPRRPLTGTRLPAATPRQRSALESLLPGTRRDGARPAARRTHRRRPLRDGRPAAPAGCGVWRAGRSGRTFPPRRGRGPVAAGGALAGAAGAVGSSDLACAAAARGRPCCASVQRRSPGREGLRDCSTDTNGVKIPSNRLDTGVFINISGMHCINSEGNLHSSIGP